MTLEIAIVLGFLVGAMILFTTEVLSVDVVALGLVSALMTERVPRCSVPASGGSDRR